MPSFFFSALDEVSDNVPLLVGFLGLGVLGLVKATILVSTSTCRCGLGQREARRPVVFKFAEAFVFAVDPRDKDDEAGTINELIVAFPTSEAR